MIMYFEDLTSIYVCKVVKNAVNNTYDVSNYDLVLKTAANTGNNKFIFYLLKINLLYEDFGVLMN